MTWMQDPIILNIIHAGEEWNNPNTKAKNKIIVGLVGYLGNIRMNTDTLASDVAEQPQEDGNRKRFMSENQ